MNLIQDILERMKIAREDSRLGAEDAEIAHSRGDELLCELIRHLAQSHEQREEIEEILSVYADFHKWYA